MWTHRLRRGSGTWSGPSTSTRTCSGTGSGRSTTTSAPTTGPSSAGARTSGTRSAIGGPTPSAAVPARAASFRSGAPTARWSATGCTSSAPGPCSTCAPATPTSWSGAIPTYAIGFDSTEFWPSNLVQQMPSQDIGGIFPVVSVDQFIDPVARLVAQPEPQLHGSAQRVAEPRQSQHPQRSRHAVDQRLQRELQQFRRQPRFHPAVHAQHDQQHRRARGERLRVIPPGRAEQRLRGRQPEAALPVVLRGALDPGRLARQQQADAEPRLPLGHQRFRDGRKQHAELRVRPDDRQSGVGDASVCR